METRKSILLGPTVTSLEEDRTTVQQALRVRGHGSLLRGWRLEMDPDGTYECKYQWFCDAAKRMGLAVNIQRLFAEESLDSLTLEELAPHEGELVDKFRRWMVARFGDPIEMFSAFEPAADEYLTKEGFLAGCGKYGFVANVTDLSDIFSMLDRYCQGQVPVAQVMFLEGSGRMAGLFGSAKERAKVKHISDTNLITFHREMKQKALSPRNRNALRLWHVAEIERLPILFAEKVRDHQRYTQRKKDEARRIFFQHLNSAHGNHVRAWRKTLDPGNKFMVSRAALSRYCRSVDLKINFAYLWKVLSESGNGNHLTLEQTGYQTSACLAAFRRWVVSKFGTCASLWAVPETMATISQCAPGGGLCNWDSNRCMPVKVFTKLMHSFGYTCSRAEDQMIRTCLPLNSGIIFLSDLEWLDLWQAPSYLYAEPNREAWEKFRGMLLQMYKTPLNAWRKALDIDDSNEVSFFEFQKACEKVKFSDDVAGAWRYADEDSSGMISLQEFDDGTSDMLTSFKTWVDQNFGSVEQMFEVLDTEGECALTLSQLKRACKRFNWTGNLRGLFEMIQANTSKDKAQQAAQGANLRHQELEFLDNWASGAADQPDRPVVAPRTTTAEIVNEAPRRLSRSESLPTLEASKLDKQQSPRFLRPGGLSKAQDADRGWAPDWQRLNP